MKLIIDIPEEDYNFAKREVANGRIAKGTPISDNATNGDIIKIIFPQLKIRKLPDIVIVFGEDNIFQHHYPIEWWNTPYKAESEG